MAASPKVIVIDNYDSFVYNLVQYLGELNADPVVYRNNAISVDEIASQKPNAILLSPGPGAPERALLSNEIIRQLGSTIPIFGVCLGHQCIGHVFGASVVRAPMPMHGKTSLISHVGLGVFHDLPNPFKATRYHSLVIDEATIPSELEVTAHSDDGLVMGVKHRDMPIVGVQFHPESIITDNGRSLLTNFLLTL